MFMPIPKPLDKELKFVLPSSILKKTFNFVSRSESISSDRTRQSMCPGGELIIWILQPGSRKGSVDSHSTRGSEGNFDGVVVYLRDAAEEFIESHEDRLEFVKLRVFREAAGRDLDQVSNLVLRRGMAAFVGLLRHCNTTAYEHGLDRIPKGIRYHVRTDGGTRDDNSFFELGSKTNAESVRGGIPRSINISIKCHLHGGESGQPVQSLS